MHARTRASHAVLSLALGVVAAIASTLGASRAANDASTDEQLPVAVTVDDDAAATDFVVLQRDGVLYLPLLNTASLLSFVVEAPSADVAQGHAGEPTHGFRIAAGNTDALIGGATTTIDADDAVFADGMLWVSAALVSRLLPIRATLDSKQFVLHLTSTGELPRAAERRRSAEHLALAGAAPVDGPDARRGAFPYRALGLPSGDVQVVASSRAAQTEFGLRALLATDVAYMSGVLFIAADDRGLNEVRLRLSRESVDGGVFGWENLTRAEFGDIFGTSSPLIGGVPGGRGFSLSTFPLDQQTQFDSTRIEGDAPPGWQVEIYGNGRLLTFQQVTSNGRYLFERLPVLFGDNQYLLVFYGPGGERREELRRVRVGADRVPAGEWRWRVGAHQPGTSLFGIGDDAHARSSPAAIAEVGYGVLEWLSIGAFLSRAPTSSDRGAALDEFAGVLLRASVRGVALHADVVAQGNGRVGAEVGATTQVRGTSISARVSEYGGIETPDSSRAGELLDREIFLRLNRALPRWLFRGADVGLEITRDEYASGRTQTRVAPILRHQLGRVSLEHEIGLQRTGSGAEADNDWQLRSAATFDIGKIHLRTQLAGRPGGLDGVGISGLLSLSVSTYVGINYSHRMENQQDDLSVYLARDLNWSTVRFVAGHDDQQGFYGNVELSMSMAFDRHRRPVFSSRRLASGGLAEPFVFLDRDNDGVYDATRDEPLPGVGIAVDHATRPTTSDADGEMIFDSLPTLTRTVLALDAQTLADPFHQSRAAPVSFQGRPGTSFRAEFPVVETGSIQGHVFRGSGANRTPLPGVRLQLRDATGRSIAEAISQIDGYYVFERVLPGQWKVHVDVKEGMVADRSAAIGSADLEIDGLDFVL